MPYDETANQAAVGAILAGLTAMPDRSTFADRLAPVDGPDREAVQQATAVAYARAQELVGTASAQYWHDEGLRQIEAALDQADNGCELSVEDVAWLGVLLTVILVRDAAFLFFGRYSSETHLRLWTEMTRRVEPPYAPAPATLLAFAALREGDGPLARIAADRALSADSGYRFAQMICFAMDQGMTPAAISDLDFGHLAEDLAALVVSSPLTIRPILP